MEGSYKIYISYNGSHHLGWLCYDPDGMQWIDVPRLPEFSVTFEKTLAVGTELLVIGSNHNGLGVIHKFSILTNSWSLGGEMNEPRRHLFASASLGKIAIVAGGYDPGNNIIFSSAEIYNSDTGTWESLPIMNRPRFMCSGVFMDGNFYVVGGIGVDDPDEFLTCGEMYDLETRTWHVIPNMVPARHRVYEPLFLLVVENELYAALYRGNEVMKYDKGRNLWSTVGSLPEGLRPGWTAFSAYGDRLIVIGQTYFDIPRGLKVYECVPDEGPLEWNLLAVNYESGEQEFRNLSAVIARE